jgi:large conductance mechanosensitive channel
MLREFKEFALRGNVIDLAVGVVIGAAFGKIVSSLVADVLTPPIGLLLGGVDFSSLGITLREAMPPKPAVMLAYGKFLQSLFDFLIIAFVIFQVVRLINRLKREEPPAPAAPAAPSAEVTLLTEIRDLLRRGR